MSVLGKGCVFRPTVTRQRAGKKSRTRSRFYWAKHRNALDIEVRHALKLQNGDGVSDKVVAEKLLREILKRIEREMAGLTDRFVEAATTPMRDVVARYTRYLRRSGKAGRRHITQVLSYLKWMIDKTGMRHLHEPREMDALDLPRHDRRHPYARRPHPLTIRRREKTALHAHRKDTIIAVSWESSHGPIDGSRTPAKREQNASGRLAQLARAPARHAGGHRFKSCIAHP